MASKIDQLLSAFELVVNEPWTTSLSGQERIWFLVYDPSEERKVHLRLEDFETATMKSGKRWALISLKNCFPSWMANHEYKEEYFKITTHGLNVPELREISFVKEWNNRWVEGEHNVRELIFQPY